MAKRQETECFGERCRPTSSDDGVIPESTDFAGNPGDAPGTSTIVPEGSTEIHTRTKSGDDKTQATDGINGPQTSFAQATVQPTGNTVSATDAAATATATAASAQTTSHGSDGVSKGAVAGIAIGTAILGAAIAFFIAFILFKRRKQSKRHSPWESTPELVSFPKAGQSPYVQVSQTPVPPPAPMAAAAVAPRRSLDLANLSNSSDFLAGVLPRAADDQTVKNKVVALFNQIQQHVDNYYRDVHASITPSMEGDLARFGKESEGMVEMLQNSSSPTVAIKHALAAYILSITSPEGEHESTLFPTEIASFKDRDQFAETSDLSAAYILYKRLAVHLHSSTTSTSQARQSDIREASEHFALTFFPWANPTYGDQEKDEDLVQVINSALEINIWLYGQPFLYEFLWEGVGRRGTVVLPGLAKVTDSQGRIAERSEMLLEPVVYSS